MASVVGPQRQRAGGPAFPETEDLFWLKQHRMWWRNYLRESTNSDSKHIARAASVVIRRLSSSIDLWTLRDLEEL